MEHIGTLELEWMEIELSCFDARRETMIFQSSKLFSGLGRKMKYKEIDEEKRKVFGTNGK